MSDYRDLIYQDALKQEAWRKKVFPTPKLKKFAFQFRKWKLTIQLEEMN